MSYTLLRGEFVIRYPDLPREGPEPDGDTVKFAPTHARWSSHCHASRAELPISTVRSRGKYTTPLHQDR